MSETTDLYKGAGFMHKIGFGKKPAMIIIDLQRAFTEGGSPLGGDLDRVLQNTSRLLETAREKGVFVIYTRVEYETDLKDAGLWIKKIPSLSILKRGSVMVDIDPLLKPQPNEIIIVKKFASAFFGTNLTSLLNSQGIDTLIITGCTTSGCIRATAIDTVQNGFHPIIPIECIGDRSREINEFNLIEINAKYADTVSLSEVLEYMDGLSG